MFPYVSFHNVCSRLWYKSFHSETGSTPCLVGRTYIYNLVPAEPLVFYLHSLGKNNYNPLETSHVLFLPPHVLPYPENIHLIPVVWYYTALLLNIYHHQFFEREAEQKQN